MEWISRQKIPARNTFREAVTIFGMHFTADETHANSTVREAITKFGKNTTSEGTPARKPVREAIIYRIN